MSQEHVKRAKALLEKLEYLAGHQKYKSDEIITYYAELNKCYGSAPPNQQIVINELVNQANKIYDSLPNRLVDQSGQEETNMTGLEAYDLLKAATRLLNPGSTFFVNPKDVKNLIKLKASDLMQRGCSESKAEAISPELFNPKLDPLGEHLGVVLIEDKSAPRLGS